MPGSGSMVSKTRQGGEEHSKTSEVEAKLIVAGGSRWRTTCCDKMFEEILCDSHLVVLVVAGNKAAQFNPRFEVQQANL